MAFVEYCVTKSILPYRTAHLQLRDRKIKGKSIGVDGILICLEDEHNWSNVSSAGAFRGTQRWLGLEQY